MLLLICYNYLTRLKFPVKNSVYKFVDRRDTGCVYPMNDEFKRKELLSELKNILEKAEEIEETKDIYCALMKTMILNTYSVN